MRSPLPACLICVSLATSAHAQSTAQLEQLKLLSIEELAETDVTGSGRRPERLDSVAASVSVITADDLRRYGVMNLPQALRLADALHVSQIGGPSWAITPRGFSISTANKVLVMIDGRTVYSPVFGGMFWEAQDIVIADIERIEVVRGPGGTLWGANAVNGVIHVITKSAADTRGTFVNTAIGTSVFGPFAIRHGGRIGRGGSYRVYAKVRAEEPHELLSGGESPADHDFGQLGFRIESDRAGASTAVVQGDLFSGRTGLPGEREIDLAGANLLARWTTRAVDGAETSLQAYVDHFYRYVPAQYRGALHTFDVDAQHQRSLGRHLLVFGGGYRQYRGDDEGFGPGFAFEPRKRVSHRSNAFAQVELNVRRRVFVTLGSKVEHNEFTGAELQPTAAVRWTRGPQTLWGSVSRAVRVPTRLDVDLRIFAPNDSLLITGSDTFRSESLTAFEVGYRTRLRDHVALDVAVYDNRYDDLRSQESPVQPGRPIVLANMLNATTRGVEASATVDVTPWWQVHGGYTYGWKRFSFDAGSTDRTRGVSEANDPSHIVKARSHVNIGPRLELDAFFRYIGALPQPAVDAYAELDARVGWRLRPGWDVSLIGAHLLHRRHLQFRGSTPPEWYERSVTLRSTWRF